MNKPSGPWIRKPWPLAFTLFLMGTVDVTRRLLVGGTTGLGLLTVGAGAVTALYGLSLLGPYGKNDDPPGKIEPFLPERATIPWPLWLFLGWALAVSIKQGLSQEGIQNLSVYVLFIVGAACVALNGSASTARWVVRWFGIVGLAASVLYAVSALAFGLSTDVLYSPRAFALMALVAMAVTIPIPRESGWLMQWTPYLILAAIGLSLSRTAALSALIILAARVVRGRRGGRFARALLLVGGIIAAAYWFVLSNDVLYQRVFGGDRALALGGVNLNTEGRTVLWAFVNQQIATNPLIGHGAGAASLWIHFHVPSETQPHCDYLRLLDDFGWVGLLLWCVGYLWLLVGCWTRARRTLERAAAVPHYAAALALLAVAITMATDNVIIYPFVMCPLGVLVGASWADQPKRGAGQPRFGVFDTSSR